MWCALPNNVLQSKLNCKCGLLAAVAAHKKYILNKPFIILQSLFMQANSDRYENCVILSNIHSNRRCATKRAEPKVVFLFLDCVKYLCVVRSWYGLWQQLLSVCRLTIKIFFIFVPKNIFKVRRDIENSKYQSCLRMPIILRIYSAAVYLITFWLHCRYW